MKTFFPQSIVRPLTALWSAASLLLAGVAGLAAETPAASGTSTGHLTNALYRLEPLAAGGVRVHAGPVHADFAPAFTVLLRKDNPGLT